MLRKKDLLEWSHFRAKNTLSRAGNLTAFIHSSTGPVVQPFASRHEGPRFNPQGVFMWNRDSPVSVVRTSSRTVTRPPCRQCDNPTWPHITLLSRFHTCSRSSSGLTTDIVGCWGGALWRVCNLTAFIHSSTSPVVHPLAYRHKGPGFNLWILLLMLSCYNIWIKKGIGE